MTLRLLLFTAAALAAQTPRLDEKLFSRLEYRSIGPASMGGRITDVEGIPGDPNTVFVASASGGLFKTTNGGVSWTSLFDRQTTISIGDIAIDPTNHDVIWVGTGEANARNSVSFGDGVYKSLDGGRTWRNLGLKDTRHISRVAINPKNPNIVYVAALGHNWGPNEERGVFMTADGGETWKKILYIDAEHGAADLDIDPQNPNIVYATMWQFDRKPWRFISGSEKTGVFRTMDGGKTWTKLTNGLAKRFGRIGVAVAASNPNVVYVIGESNEGTLWRSDNRGETFRLMTRSPEVVGRGLYYSHMRVDPADENRVICIAMGLYLSIDGGRTVRRISGTTHGDYHTIWIDPRNPQRIWQGQDGGIAVSYDRGERWEWVGNLPLGQFYQIFADNRQPFYYLSGGLQDNGTWVGPSRSKMPALTNADWRMVSWGDGFHVVAHADQPELFVSESQGGGIVRTDMRTGEQQDVSIQPRRNDGGPVGELKWRFNWNAPIVMSPHDRNTIYFGSQAVWKSTDFGKTWTQISPDLSTNDPEKIKSVGTVWTENTTAEYHCTVIRIAESPVKPGVLWAGTDDGNLQLTTDGGKTWTNLTGNWKGVPKFAEVQSIEASRTDAGTAYVAFDHHWFDDLRPYIFKTTDYGKTWTQMTSGLPETNWVHVVREDPKNPRLLYAGTELGLYVSFNGGGEWTRMHLKNLPPVAVHDLLVHPRENDLVLGTHGRSLWILDDATPLQQMAEATLQQTSALFDLRPALRFNGAGRGAPSDGDKPFMGPNPAYGAPITYWLKEKGEAKLEILDAAGKVIRTLANVPGEAGLQRVTWDLRMDAARRRREPSEMERAFARFGGGAGPNVLPGRYTVRLTAGGQTLSKPLEVRTDPTVTVSEAELRTLYDMTTKLREMQSAANDALRLIDSYTEQIGQAEKNARAVLGSPKDLLSALDERKKQLASIETRMARKQNIPGYSEGPKLADRLQQLSGAIDRVLTGPTAPQKDLFAELTAELDKELGNVNRFVTRDVPEINDLLKKYNGGALTVAKPLAVGSTGGGN